MYQGNRRLLRVKKRSISFVYEKVRSVISSTNYVVVQMRYRIRVILSGVLEAFLIPPSHQHNISYAPGLRFFPEVEQ